MRTLVAIPVFNEAKYVRRVLPRVLERVSDVLVIDDGSTDETPGLVREFPVRLVQREVNAGYGRSIRDAFAYARNEGFDWLITMDCDEQHEPASIPRFVEVARSGAWDVISGSRYLDFDVPEGSPPEDRRAINGIMTAEINRRLGLGITDAFCGFKAYRVSALGALRPTEDGYAQPMQFWVQAAASGLRITEVPVRLIYNDPTRTFGGPLNDPSTRLAHYRRVLHCELRRQASRLPGAALADVCCP